VLRHFLAFLAVSFLTPSSILAADQLVVSEDGRYLTYDDGRPFFYLGDTAWELFHRLDREEANLYLENRARIGFTVIQTVALAEQDGLNTPNAYGHRPLIDNDPTRPDVKPGPRDDYWDHVDYIVEKAESLKMFIGMLPTWGDKWQPGTGKGPCVFTVENARIYGRWLGERYRHKPIIWILGGDRNIKTDADRELIQAMARGLREGDGGTHLITYHPRGPGQSSDYFHDADWLDFNMFQSSHAARDHDNGLFAKHDYALKPPKPTLDGEPRYESIPVGFYNRNAARNLVFDDYDARQAAWWSLMAGACGHTYGNNNIWQMWDTDRPSVIWASIPWHEAIHHPGAFQMGHLRDLFESRPFLKLVPDESFVVDGPSRGAAKVRGIRASDRAFAFVYSPRGEQFSVTMGVIESPSVRASWYDPRYGATHEIHVGDNAGIQTFVPPSSGRGQDWVLILDDAEAGFKPPR
jgi:Protein of unknown function (DUF4038)/Putative collagen-binding domain of a collagenase